MSVFKPKLGIDFTLLSDDDGVDDVKVVRGVFDDGDVEEAANILFARCSTFGCETNQLQICNWSVIAPN